MIDPQRLIDELAAHGWTDVGHGRGYVRLAWPDSRGTMVVPTDPTAPEFEELADAVLAQLESAVDVGVKARMSSPDCMEPWSKPPPSHRSTQIGAWTESSDLSQVRADQRPTAPHGAPGTLNVETSTHLGDLQAVTHTEPVGLGKYTPIHRGTPHPALDPGPAHQLGKAMQTTPGANTRDRIELGQPHPAEQRLPPDAREDRTRRYGRLCRRAGLSVIFGSGALTLLGSALAQKRVFTHPGALTAANLTLFSLMIAGAIIASAGFNERRERPLRAMMRQLLADGHDRDQRLDRIEEALADVPDYGKGVIDGATMRAHVVGSDDDHR